MSRQTLSALKATPLLLWIALFVLIPAYALYEDLTGDGLKRTQAYLVLGYFLYPLFYGGCVFALVGLALMYRQRHAYITVGDGSLSIGRRTVPFADIRNVDVRRNWLGLRRLVVQRDNGRDLRLAAYILTRPVHEVAANLRTIQTPR